MRKVFLIALLLFPAAAAAAQTAAPPVATPPAAPQTRPAPPAVEAPQATPPPSRNQAPAPPGVPVMPASGNWRNVKLDITISDSIAVDAQSKKTVSMLVADGRGGQIRSTSGQITAAATEGLINIDARPVINSDGRAILLQLTIEYRPELSAEQLQKLGSSRVTSYTESLTMVVIDGRPTLISQSADPRNDRKVSVEVLATIQK